MNPIHVGIKENHEELKSIADSFHNWSEQIGELEDVKETELERLKTLGKELFNKAKYKDAISHYKDALQLNRKEVSLYSNVALCFLKLDRPDKCIDFATLGLEFDASNLKLLCRRAQAFVQRGEPYRAQKDLALALTNEPENESIRKLLRTIVDEADVGDSFYAAECTGSEDHLCIKVPIKML